MACGKGRYVNSQGTEYVGTWVNDMQHGRGSSIRTIIGVEKWADGSVYEGDYDSGKKSGKGKFSWPDGSSYEGKVLQNLLDGDGKLSTIFRRLQVEGWTDLRWTMEEFTDVWEGSLYMA